MKLREATVNIWSATGTTMGALAVVAVVVTGSAAVGSVTLSDGTDLKYVFPVTITGQNQFLPSNPVRFSNLIVAVVSTAGWSVSYLPKP